MPAALCYSRSRTRCFIISQRYRNRDFYKGTNSFTASNGFTLTSDNVPAASLNTDRIYVRGRTEAQDRAEISFYTPRQAERFEQAVKEYNRALECQEEKACAACVGAVTCEEHRRECVRF